MYVCLSVHSSVSLLVYLCQPFIPQPSYTPFFFSFRITSTHFSFSYRLFCSVRFNLPRPHRLFHYWIPLRPNNLHNTTHLRTIPPCKLYTFTLSLPFSSTSILSSTIIIHCSPPLLPLLQAPLVPFSLLSPLFPPGRFSPLLPSLSVALSLLSPRPRTHPEHISLSKLIRATNTTKSV